MRGAMQRILFVFWLFAVLVFAGNHCVAHAQHHHRRHKVSLLDDEEKITPGPSAPVRITFESVAWFGGATLATGVGFLGYMSGLSGGDGSPSTVLILSGTLIGIFGIPFAVWLADGMRGSYPMALLSNLLGAGISIGFAAAAATVDNDAGILLWILAFSANPVIAISMYEGTGRSEIEPHRSPHSRIVPIVAPTSNFDGATLGFATTF